jgi:hypothetical protein
MIPRSITPTMLVILYLAKLLNIILNYTPLTPQITLCDIICLCYPQRQGNSNHQGQVAFCQLLKPGTCVRRFGQPACTDSGVKLSSIAVITWELDSLWTTSLTGTPVVGSIAIAKVVIVVRGVPAVGDRVDVCVTFTITVLNLPRGTVIFFIPATSALDFNFSEYGAPPIKVVHVELLLHEYPGVSGCLYITSGGDHRQAVDSALPVEGTM